mmetsp:Transcript_43173/g.46860  ORF Transcript_43173/g.46860 Transcript_43173/m.46860 type:complete len:332 (+) Transcript_43173:107-1102(+)
MSKTLQRKLKAKIPNSFQGPEWDSSDEEDSEPVKKRSPVEKNKTKKHSSKSESTKKGIKYDKKLDVDREDENEENDLALYIGHLPREFEEIDLRRFLSQFGKVYNCRVARKIETGNPKGFAFVRFADDEVTKIACETLHGYFLDKQRLVCQVRTSHPGMFFDTDKMIDRRRKNLQLETKQRNKNLANSEKLKAITSRLVIRELKKRERLEALGIDYDFPGYKSNRTEFEEQFVPKENIDTVEVEVDEEDITGINDNHSSPTKGTGLKDGKGNSKKKTRRKDSFDNEGTASEKKKRRKNSIDKDEQNDSKHERPTKSMKKEKKKKNKRRSAP